MKKTKLISLILVVLMLTAMLPMFTVTSSATTATQETTALPTIDPVDKKSCYAVEAYSFADGIDFTSPLTGEYSDGYTTLASNDMKNMYPTKYEEKSLNGVKGIMVPIDTTGNEKSQAQLYIRINMAFTSKSYANGSQSDVQLVSHAKGGTTSTFTTTGYLFNGSWKTVDVSYSTKEGVDARLYIDKGLKGYFYVPLDNFSYAGGGANGATENGNSVPLMSVIDKFPTDYVRKIGYWVGNAKGTKIGNVYFVYDSALPKVADNNAVSQTLTLAGSSSDNAAPTVDKAPSVVGNAAATREGNTVTVTKCNANSLSARGQDTVWFFGNTGDVKPPIASATATGIRFYIDTSGVAEGICVQPRIRLNIGKDWKADGYEVYDVSDGAEAGATTKLNNHVQGICHSPNSVLYYLENGTWKTLKLTSGIISFDDNNAADLFGALPDNFCGDIYIPFESFDIGVQGSDNSTRWVDLTKYPSAIAKIYKIGISHALTEDTEEQTVIYKDFEVVYDNTAIDNLSVTVKNDLSMNVYAKVEDGAENVKVIFGTEVLDNPEKVENLYKFTYDGILPQNMTDTFDITLSADIGGKTATKTIEAYSVRKNLEALYKQTEDEKLKALIDDMLIYGAAAQKYANYKIDDLASDNLDSVSVNKDEITAHKGATGIAVDGYSLRTATLLLDTRIAVKFGVTALEGATVVISIGDGEDIEYDIKDGYVIFDNIGAYQLGDKITITFKNGVDKIGQTYTYSVNDYIKEEIDRVGSSDETQALVKALYNYGVSAAAYK